MKGSIISGRKHTHSQGGGRAPGPYSDSGYGGAERRAHARISAVAVRMRGPHTDPDAAEHFLGAYGKQTHPMLHPRLPRALPTHQKHRDPLGAREKCSLQPWPHP